jgi:hypothetical protein
MNSVKVEVTIGEKRNDHRTVVVSGPTRVSDPELAQAIRRYVAAGIASLRIQREAEAMVEAAEKEEGEATEVFESAIARYPTTLVSFCGMVFGDEDLQGFSFPAAPVVELIDDHAAVDACRCGDERADVKPAPAARRRSGRVKAAR